MRTALEQRRVGGAAERQRRAGGAYVATEREADRLVRLGVRDIVRGEELDDVDVRGGQLALIEPVAAVRAGQGSRQERSLRGLREARAVVVLAGRAVLDRQLDARKAGARARISDGAADAARRRPGAAGRTVVPARVVVGAVVQREL